MRFEYENIYESVSLDDFTDELTAFCDEWIETRYAFGMALRICDLYSERAFVALVHYWTYLNGELDRLTDEGYVEGDSIYDGLYEEVSCVSWAIAHLI